MTSRILIAGFGSIGRRHFRNLRALGYTDFMFYRHNRSALDDKEIAGFKVFADLGEALAQRPAITVIANPTSLHLPVALPAARAGSHLFIEKPLSHSATECDELASIVQRNRLTVMLGCQWRFHPLLMSLRRQLIEGRIGQVLGSRAEYGEFLPSWHPWEDHRQSYSARDDLGGGVVLTLIHSIDYMYWLFGAVARVHASMRRAPFLNTATKDDLAEITLEFRSGVIAQVHLDYVQRPPTHTLVVWGEQGRASLDFGEGVLRWEIPDAPVAAETVPDGFERNSMFMDEMKHFLSAVDEGKPTCIPLEDGRAVLEIALKAKEDAAARCG